MEEPLSAQKIEKDKRNEVQKYLTEKFGESFAFNQAQVMPTMPTEKQNQVKVMCRQLLHQIQEEEHQLMEIYLHQIQEALIPEELVLEENL